MANKPKKPELPAEVREFFQKTGAQGGKARAQKHAGKLSEWGRLGGRPKKATNKSKGEK